LERWGQNIAEDDSSSSSGSTIVVAAAAAAEEREGPRKNLEKPAGAEGSSSSQHDQEADAE
jgi:hypothetical protein